MDRAYYDAPDHKNDLFSQLGLGNDQSEPQTNLDNINIKNIPQTCEEQQTIKTQAESEIGSLQVKTENHIIQDKEDRKQTKISSSKNKKAVRRVGRGNKKRKKKEEKKQQIQIEIDTNEVAEWGEKGTRLQSDDDSFDDDSCNEEVLAEKKEGESEVRKKIEEKLEKYQTQPKKIQTNNVASSLKNKAEQLRKKNEEANMKNQENNHETSTQNLQKQPEKHEIQEEEENESNESDPWEKINERTMNKQKQKEKVREQLSVRSVIQHFQELGSANRETIEDELENEKIEPSFWQSICSCFKQKNRKFTQVEIQVISLSKMKLGNSLEQNFLLREIWSQLVGKSYQRYGSHWGEIGFQGRDPATDLRSAGILSLIYWLTFIEEHKEYSIQIQNFCGEFDIPLALTHIKITGLIVKLLKRRELHAKTWEDYQQWFNALTYHVFSHLKGKASRQQLGELVEKVVEKAGKQSILAKKNYHSQHEK